MAVKLFLEEEARASWWGFSPIYPLSEVTERQIVGECADCQDPIWADDTGMIYCEGCEN